MDARCCFTWLIAVTSSLLLSIICICCFYNSLDNDFTFDDSLALVNNGDVTSELHNNQLWGNDLWGKDIRAHDSHKSYRPLLIKLFQIISKYLGSKPVCFRQYSIGFHVLATLLVRSLGVTITNSRALGFAAALLFAVHPIHVEAVASIVNMAEAIHTILVILSYYLFIQSINQSSRPVWKLALSTIVWLLFIAIAILFKETALNGCVLIFAKTVMAIVMYLVNRFRHFRNVSTGSNRKSDGYSSVLLYTYWNVVALFTCYIYFSFRSLLINTNRDELLSSVSHFLYRLLVNPALLTGPGASAAGSYLGSSQLIRKAENPFAFLYGQEKVLSMLYLHFRYLYLLIMPFEQSPEYSFNCIPSIAQWDDHRNLYWIGAYMIVFLLGCIGIYHATCRKSVDCSNSLTTETSRVVECSTTVLEPHIEPAKLHILTTESDSHSPVPSSAPHSQTTSAGSDETCSNDGIAENSESVEVAASSLHNTETVIEEKHVESASDVDYSDTAILDSLIWLVVPFIPLSGVVFKLGTLLAERLLYMSSIGSCLLLVIIVYSVCKYLVLGVSKMVVTQSSAKELKYNRVISMSLFWAVILIVTTLFYRRTVEYNSVWINNETLFIRSLAVCPNSAKMHIQVSKVYSGKGDYHTAREHVMRAKEIDPDFCDIGYQEALLSISIDNSAEDALEHALGNLRCVYSNTGSMQLVTQLWNMELNAHSGPNKHMGLYKTIAKQASQAVNAGLELLGAKKFLEASSTASEAKQYKKAISLSVQAEKILLAVEATNRNVSTKPEDMVPVPIELKCRIFLVSGTHRAFYAEYIKTNSTKQKIVVDKPIKRELSRTKELLFKSIEPECVKAGVANGVAGMNQLHIALNYLAGIINSEVDQSKVESVEEYAQLLSKSYLMLYYQQQLNSVAMLTNSREGDAGSLVAGSSEVVSQSTATLQTPFGDLNVIRDNAARAWNTVGNWYQKARQLDEATESFEEALRLFAVLPLSNGGVNERHSASISTLKRYLSSMELTTVSCNTLYWYSDALAGREGFTQSETQVRMVIRVLKTYLKCPVFSDSSSASNRAEIASMIEKMENYVRRPADMPQLSDESGADVNNSPKSSKRSKKTATKSEL